MCNDLRRSSTRNPLQLASEGLTQKVRTTPGRSVATLLEDDQFSPSAEHKLTEMLLRATLRLAGTSL